MTEANVQTEQPGGYLILFCGAPGTLKTYLSVRLSGRLGYGYLPTRAVGSVAENSSKEALEKDRMGRYRRLSEVAHSALDLGANVVLDGGFESSEARTHVLDGLDPQKTLIIHCLCSDPQVRKRRLEVRAKDTFDYENSSANEILRSISDRFPPSPQDDPQEEVRNGRVSSVLTLDTATMEMQWEGEPPAGLKEPILDILNELLKEHNDKRMPYSFRQGVVSHFDDLAEQYETSTEWRKEPSLLKALQRPLPQMPARILDVGAGTGLASSWYADQGHNVVGVDVSPAMLRKAAERLTLTVLNDAAKLPFLDSYFDLVIIRQCLHYLDPKRLLAEANRVLRPGGLLAVSGTICSKAEAKRLWEEFKNVTQPLRLRVFTEDDIAQLLSATGFDIEERLHHTIVRRESLLSLGERAPAPPGGWVAFLTNFEKIASKVAPCIKFSFEGGVVEYNQSWVTIWARTNGPQ